MSHHRSQPVGQASRVAVGLMVMTGALLATGSASGWEMTATPELFRVDPFGGVVAVDVTGDGPTKLPVGDDGMITIAAARNGYVSLNLLVRDDRGGTFTVAAESPDGIEVDLFRQWFHLKKDDGTYYPEALIPIGTDQTLSLPDGQMKIKGQKVAAIWADVWVSKKAAPGPSIVTFTLTAGGKSMRLPIRLNVLELMVPDEDAVTCDENTYTMGFVGRFFRKRAAEYKAKPGESFFMSDQAFDAIQRVHEIFYEHRSTFHQLGFSHSGQLGDQFAPKLTGQGRTRRIVDWTIFDKHYGPLLDGSAFSNSRRGPRPIEGVYLPLTPEWPAPYIWYGTKGYETEWVRILGQMEQHFREKGWTETTFELFFNHKKRYKGFEWDGDETRFIKDNEQFVYYGNLLRKGWPKDSPITIRFRHDCSWAMWNQMNELAGLVDFWVCASGGFAFYPEAVDLVQGRGDKLWIYGGGGISVWDPVLTSLDRPLKAWIYGISGTNYYQCMSPGNDPFFDMDPVNGAKTGLLFPADMFGLDLPLAGIRLKVRRNFLQDLALLNVGAEKLGKNGAKLVRAKVAMLAGTTTDYGWNPKAGLRNVPPHEWTNTAIREQAPLKLQEQQNLDGRWAQSVRALAIDVAMGKEVK